MTSPLFLLLFTLLSPGEANSLGFNFNHNSDDIEWPSCDELKSMWLSLVRISEYAEITNEIPLIPQDLLLKYPKHRHRNNEFKVPLSHHHHKLIKGSSKPIDFSEPFTNRNFINKIYPQENTNILESNMMNPFLQEKIKMDSNLGNENFLEGFTIPEISGLPSYSDNPSYEEEEPIKSPNMDTMTNGFEFGEEQPVFEGVYGLEENVGSFGDISREDEIEGHRKSNIKTVKMDHSGWHSEPISIGSRFDSPISYIKCESMEGKLCSSDENCSCGGKRSWKCVNRQCQSAYDSLTEIKNIGKWHDGPLQSFQLGLTKQRRKREKLHKST